MNIIYIASNKIIVYLFFLEVKLKVIAVANYKGGVGKTTLVANIATELAIKGSKVLIIDLDPQASLTFSFIHIDEWETKYKDDKTIKNWFDNTLNNNNSELDDYIITDLKVNKNIKDISTEAEEISLISSHIGLFNVQLELAKNLKDGYGRKVINSRLKTLTMLSKGLEKLQDKFDIVLIDCQPSFDLITQNALVASNAYFIPTKLDYLSTLGVDTLNMHIKDLITELNKGIKKYSIRGYGNIETKPLGTVGTMVQHRNGLIAINQQHYDNLKRGSIKVFKTTIRLNQTAFDSETLIPVVATNANSDVVQEMKELTKEFMKRLIAI